MSDVLRERFDELTGEGMVENVEGRPFLALLVLESEMRYGLALRDDTLVWARVHRDRGGQEVLVFAGEGTAERFVELFEHDRRQLEDRLEAAASELGLDGEAAVLSLPVSDLVTGVLAGRRALFCRWALRWILPTELRQLRDAIAPLAGDRALPHDVRDLATRLTVPAA
jgi:hypothetical protein